MSHPRVEEVSDSDLEMSDPSEADIDDFVESDILRARNQQQSSSSSSRPSQNPPKPAPSSQKQPHFPRPYPAMATTTDESAYKRFQCLYPVYFDATRSRAEGRRVPAHLAVKNPLATEIVAACANLRLTTVLEVGKQHPKDWANPGRVKVDLASLPPNAPVKIKNKHHLYLLVAQHLRENPTSDTSPALHVVVRGAPPPPPGVVEPGKPWPRPAVPRGWKMGELLPYYSPAMTGGGVSENFLKDMMKEMQNAGAGGGFPGLGGDMASLLGAMGGGLGGMGVAPAAGGSSGGKKKGKK